MNNYHIYEEIGRGQHSVVYKGREKQSINYVAIKSVTKEHKPYLLPQVAVLYNLSHSNVLRFVNWYETSKFIWLIVEYCCGADLQSVLKQDTALPESSALVFALDIASGLQYVHSRGFLFGALRPSALLLNESGVLKLSNFAHAKAIPTLETANSKQRALIDDVDTSMPAYTLTGNDADPYLAPELRVAADSGEEACGSQSIASDLYSFGCVLHELVTGVPPLAPLQHLDNCSADLNDLLHRLLEPNPYTRAGWSEILAHPWFTAVANIKQLKLPAQPLYETLAEQYKQQCQHRASQQQASSVNGHHQVAQNGHAADVSHADWSGIAVAASALSLADQDTTQLEPQASCAGSSGSARAPHPTPARPANGYSSMHNSPAMQLDRSVDPAMSLQSELGRNLLNSSHLNGSGMSNDSYSADILADSGVRNSVNNGSANSLHNNAVLPSAYQQYAPQPANGLAGQHASATENSNGVYDSPAARLSTSTPLSADDASTAEKLLQRRNKFKQKFATLKDKYSSSSQRGTVNRTTSLTTPAAMYGSPSSEQLVTPRKTQPRSRTLDKLAMQPARNTGDQQIDSPVQQENQHDNWSADGADVMSTNLTTFHSPLAAPATAAATARTRLPLRRTATATSIASARSNSARLHRRSGGSGGQVESVGINSKSSDFLPSPTLAPSLHASQQGGNSAELQHLLFTSLDSSIKPLIGNAKIEKLSWSSKWSSKLSFEPLAPLEILSLRDSQQLERFLTAIYREVGGDPSASNAQRLNALTYLQTIITDSNIANLVINSSLCALIIRLAQQTNATPINLAASVLHTIGLLLRHATIINPDVPLTPLAVNSVEREKSMLTVLTDATRDGLPVQTRRRAVCALGELIFFVASQTSPCLWKVSQAAYKQMLRMLRTEEDEVVRHYACMTIHNVLCHLTEVSNNNMQHPAVTWFVNSETLLSLLALFQSSKNLHLRSITMAAMSAIARADTALLGKLIDKLQWSALCGALEDESPRVQQAALNMVNMALHHRLARVHSLCCKDPQLLESLLRLIIMSDSRHRSSASDMSSPLLTRRQHTARTQTQNKQLLEVRQALRGKAFLTLALLLDVALAAAASITPATINLSATLSRPSSSSASLVTISSTAAVRLLAAAFDQGLATHIDRSDSDSRDHQHLQSCLQYLRTTLLSANEWMLTEVSGVVKQVASRRNSTTEQLRLLSDMLQCYPLTERLLQTSYCRSHVFTASTLTSVRQQVDALISAQTTAVSAAAGSNINSSASAMLHGQYQQQLMLLLEAMKHHTASLTELPAGVLLSFLQSVRQLIQTGKQPELLFTAATAFTDILTVLLTQPQIYSAAAMFNVGWTAQSTERVEALQESDVARPALSNSLNELLSDWLQSTFRVALQLQQPVPQHTLRAAAVFTRIQPQLAHSFYAWQLLPLLLQQYTADSVNCSVHLCQLLVSILRLAPAANTERSQLPAAAMLTQCAAFFQHVLQHRLSAYYEVQGSLLAVLLGLSPRAASLPPSVMQLAPALTTLLEQQLAQLVHHGSAAAAQGSDDSMDVDGGDEGELHLRRSLALLPCLLRLQLQQSTAPVSANVMVTALQHVVAVLVPSPTASCTSDTQLLLAGVLGLLWLSMQQSGGQLTMDAATKAAARRALQQVLQGTSDDRQPLAALLPAAISHSDNTVNSSVAHQLSQLSLHQLVTQLRPTST